MRIFISYNRDELLVGEDYKKIIEKIENLIKQDSNAEVYFDNLTFDNFTDPEIFQNIEQFLNVEGTILVLISDSLMCYGWAQKEIRYARKIGREIRRINIKKFLRLLNRKRVSFKKIKRRSILIRKALKSSRKRNYSE